MAPDQRRLALMIESAGLERVLDSIEKITYSMATRDSDSDLVAAAEYVGMAKDRARRVARLKTASNGGLR